MSQKESKSHLFQSKVAFLKKLPTNKRMFELLGGSLDLVVVIYDRRLEKQDDIKKWLKQDDKVLYPVTAGEKLKDLDAFAGHTKKLVKLIGSVSPQRMLVVGLGGGTVGDFAGFFASVYKRGVPLVHLPTTLLAAIDSAHGGKTALNIGGVKNQVGSFYPAKAVMLTKDVFLTVPQTHVFSAAGELAKMALIEGGSFFEEIHSVPFDGIDHFWKFLPQTIDAKNRIVEVDPYETSGERQILNLGHTFGHAIETYYDIPHGTAVGLGLAFACYWSHHYGFLNFQDLDIITDFLHDKIGIQRVHQFLSRKKPLTRAKLEKLVSEDKKMSRPGHVSFIFLEGIGKPLRKSVSIDSFLTEAQRQGWVAS